MSLERFITKSNEATTVDKLYGLLEGALAELCGFDRVIFSLMSDHASLKLPAGHGIMRNYPDDWMKHYVEQGYEHIDPVRRFGFRHVGPFIWDSLPLVMNLAAPQETCMDECRAAGFHNGAAICLRGILGEYGGIGVAASAQKKAFSPLETKRILSTLNIVAHQFYNNFYSFHEPTGAHAGAEVILTKREREILRCIARRLTDDDIGFELHISRHAVDFHIRNILKKFDAPNRVAALLIAIKRGMIALDETLMHQMFSRRLKR